MASDAVTVIMNDHRVMERIFDELQSGEGDRKALLNECAARLTAHSHAEEQRVYPALSEADPDERDEVHHGADEHHEAEKLLHNLQRMGPDDPNFDAKLDEFISAVKHHVEEEESEILPALREAVSKERLDELGAAFEEIRLEELRVAGIEEDATAASSSTASSSTASGSTASGSTASGSSASSSSASADDMTRDELYEKAKEADIPGRSTMNKDELAKALRRAQH